METNDFYMASCNQDDVDAFCKWLLSQGFTLMLEQPYFRGVTKKFGRKNFGIAVLLESGGWTISLSNDPNYRWHPDKPWFYAEDVMEFLNKGVADRFCDPGKSMKFLMENLDEVQRMFDSPSFEIAAKQLNQRRLCRQDRLWPNGRRGLKNGN